MSDPVTDLRRVARTDPWPGTDTAPARLDATQGLLQEVSVDEPYRPELVARLERAVWQGRYCPDARAIADALVRKLDSLE